MEPQASEATVAVPVLRCYTRLLGLQGAGPALLVAVTGVAVLLLVVALVDAAVSGRLGWLAAGVLLFSVGYLHLAPTSTLAYERTRDAMLGPMLTRLEVGQQQELAARLGRPRVRLSLLAAGLLPPALALVAYLSADTLFDDVLAFGGPGSGLDWVNLIWLIPGAVFAGIGLAASLESIWISLAFTRFPESWNPLEPGSGSNREDVARFALSAAMRFVLTGGWLLPGIAAVAVVLDGGGLGAVIAIASTVLVTGAALLIVPATAIQRRSKADKRAHLQALAGRIEPLQQRLETGESEDPQRDYYNVRCLLAMRSQMLQEPASPDSVDLVRQLPSTTIVPLLATVLSVPFV